MGFEVEIYEQFVTLFIKKYPNLFRDKKVLFMYAIFDNINDLTVYNCIKLNDKNIHFVEENIKINPEESIGNTVIFYLLGYNLFIKISDDKTKYKDLYKRDIDILENKLKKERKLLSPDEELLYKLIIANDFIYSGNESGHFNMDEIICDELEKIGYKKSVKFYNKCEKWYS